MLVSAVIADGPPRRVLDLAADGLVQLILPEPVPDELGRVLDRKLGLDAAAIEAILALISTIAVATAAVPEGVEAATGDPDDDRILAAAIAAGCDALVSGDRRHLLPLGRHGGMRIIRPQELVAELTG